MPDSWRKGGVIRPLGGRGSSEERPRGLSMSLDIEDLGPAVGEDQLGQLLQAKFTDSKGTTTRDVFVPEPKPDDVEDE
jgi:hypothetical protein